MLAIIRMIVVLASICGLCNAPDSFVYNAV